MVRGQDQKWWKGIDLQKAAEEPQTAPEWIEQTNGGWRKPEYYKWVPDEWQYLCMVCGSSGTPADQKHVESDGHQKRLLWKLNEMDGVDFATIRRVVKNEDYNYWDPHHLGEQAQHALTWHQVGSTPASSTTPADSAAPTPRPVQCILPAPPGLVDVPMEDIRSLRDAIVDLTTVVRDLGAMILGQHAASSSA